MIVKEDRRAPTAAHMVWYRAGQHGREKNGTTGVAHLLEHMMFKGRRASARRVQSRVAAAGGRDNAFTSRITRPISSRCRAQLEQMMQLEADRMRHLNLAGEFAQEIKVVMEERRLRTDDQPTAPLFEQMRAVAFQAHPYRVPVIGWMNDLENMTVRTRATGTALVRAEQRLCRGRRRRRSSGGFGWSNVLRQAGVGAPSGAQDAGRQKGIRRLTVKAARRGRAAVVIMAYKGAGAARRVERMSIPTRWNARRHPRWPRGGAFHHLVITGTAFRGFRQAPATTPTRGPGSFT